MTSQIRNPTNSNNKTYQIQKNQNSMTKISESPAISREMISEEKQENLYKVPQRSTEVINSENQMLRVQIKKLRVRQNHLYEEEINLEPMEIFDANEEKIKYLQKELYVKSTNIKLKYQKSISTLLQYYGCTEQESDLSKLNNESEIIEFLMNKFHEKANQLRKYDKDMNQKISQLNQQITKLKDSIKQMNSAGQINHLKQQKYKETLKQLKSDWLTVCEKLSKKDLEIDKIHRQAEYLKSKLKQQQQKINMQQNELKQAQQANAKLENRIYEISHKNTQNTINFQELYNAYEQSQILIKQYQFKEKKYEQEQARLLRQLARSKQRYEFVQKKIFDSGDLFPKNTQNIKEKVNLLKPPEEKIPKYLTPKSNISKNMKYESFRTFSPINQQYNYNKPSNYQNQQSNERKKQNQVQKGNHTEMTMNKQDLIKKVKLKQKTK